MSTGLLAFVLSLSAAAAMPPAASTPSALLDQSRAAVRNDPDLSRELAERALRELARRPDADQQARAHALLCEHYSERDRAAAERQLAEGQALLHRTTRPSVAAHLLQCQGELAEYAGDTAQALALYERAAEIAANAHDDDMLANALYQRGYLRGVRGELASGLADLRRANDLFERLQQKEEALNTQLAAALLYDRLGDHQEARKRFEKALAEQRGAGLQREQAVTAHNLGRALESLGDAAGAKAAFTEALTISRKLGFERGQAYALRGLASVANRGGDGTAALRLLAEASALLDRAPDQRLHAQIALQRGIALRLQHRYGDSVAALDEALRIFDGAGAKTEATTTRGELASSLAAQGDYKAAYEQAGLAKAASDELLRRQIEQRFASLRIEFQTSTTERENEALRRENAATERALAQEQRANTLRSVSLALAVLLLLGVSALLVRHWRDSRRMRGLAMTDELTRLHNRRHALGALEARLARGSAGALLIADLDLFKPINDEHGHLVGDEILRRVADRLRESAPAGADIGRLGGEEFVLVLPGADRARAEAAAEAVRAAVAALDVSRWLRDRGVTVSIGATDFGPGDGVAPVLHRADGALYDAKYAGRDRVCWRSRDEALGA